VWKRKRTNRAIVRRRRSRWFTNTYGKGGAKLTKRNKNGMYEWRLLKGCEKELMNERK